MIDNTERYYIKNVYMRVNGTLGALPFNSPKQGMWLFDEQIYYFPKPRSQTQVNGMVASDSKPSKTSSNPPKSESNRKESLR